MVLADLGRKITSALRSLSNATVINEEVSVIIIILQLFSVFYEGNLLFVCIFWIQVGEVDILKYLLFHS